MSSKPTYQELENQIIELKNQQEISLKNYSLECDEKYHSLFKNMVEGFAQCKMIYRGNKAVDFRYLEVNNAFEKLTGLKNVEGKLISEILVNHKTENPKLFNLYARVAKTGISEKIETYVPTLKNWFAISVYSSEKGQFLVIFSNIDERKKFEESLVLSESQFRGLFTQSHVGTAIVGLDKCFIKINDTFCQFLGYREEEMLGKKITDFTHPGDVELGMSDIKRIVDGEIEFSVVQKRYLRKDGTIVWGELTISIVKDEQNNPLYFLPVIQDITERIKAEKDLKESEARFKALIKNSFDMIVLIDYNGIQQFVSESCEKILGFKQEELIGIPVIEKMIHPDDRESTLNDLYDIIKNNANGGAQYRHLHKNGSWVYLEAFGNNQLDNPAIRSVVLNVRDITDRKIAEQIIKENEVKLKELNATKDKLFSIIAHDLRSPFNCILGFSELLKGKLKESDISHYEQYGTMINSSAKSTLVLLDNLLNWAKSQTGQISFNPQKIRLSSCIGEIIDLTNSQAKIKNITIKDIKSIEYEVFADENFLRLILQNLISNAIKFTHQGGEIKIGVTLSEDQVEITVSDTGIGMNEEKVASLFKIASNNTTRGTANEKGSGLGLVLCKEFVEKQGGTIWVESVEGKGTDFKFTLPLFKS